MDVFIVLIIYDLGVVVQVVDCVVVMYVGKIVEIGIRRDIFYMLQYLYIKGLLCLVFWLDLYESEFVFIVGLFFDLFVFLFGCLFVFCCFYVMEVCDCMYFVLIKLKESY